MLVVIHNDAVSNLEIKSNDAITHKLSCQIVNYLIFEIFLFASTFNKYLQQFEPSVCYGMLLTNFITDITKEYFHF